MSETQVPQSNDSQVRTNGAAPAFPHSSTPGQGLLAAPNKMSTFLKVSIILLIGLTVASISLLFIGDFEGRFERVFSTFALFAVFVVFTAIDTSRERKSDWYAPVALIANTYILGLLLIVIWITPYDAFSLMFEIFWKSLLVIVVTRLVILCCELLLRTGEKSGDAVMRFSFITSVLAVLSGILFTAPVGIEAFGLEVPDLYWKIATAVLILTALGLSVTLLLRWSTGTDERLARKDAMRGGNPGQQFPIPQFPAPQAQAAPAFQPSVNQAPAQQVQDPAAMPDSAPVVNSPAPDAPEQGFQFQQAMQEQRAQQALEQQQAADEEPELLPWPTFADGSPIPARADGQPDFTVPGAPQQPQF
ncbi:MAG: hypothetical protein ACTIJ6_01285 [Leucobacter sp.]